MKRKAVWCAYIVASTANKDYVPSLQNRVFNSTTTATTTGKARPGSLESACTRQQFSLREQCLILGAEGAINTHVHYSTPYLDDKRQSRRNGAAAWVERGKEFSKAVF